MTVETKEYFGGCPECGESDGYLNVRSSHLGVCHFHSVWWSIGCNLFSCWREEGEAQWRANEALLAMYREVKPIHIDGKTPAVREAEYNPDADIPF